MNSMSKKFSSTFIRDVLTIPASQKCEDLYSLTHQVLGLVLPLDYVNDGWIFESTLVPDADNAVIVPANGHAKLSVKNVLYAQFISADTDGIVAAYGAFYDGTVRRADGIRFQDIPKDRFNDFDEMLGWVDPQ